MNAKPPYALVAVRSDSPCPHWLPANPEVRHADRERCALGGIPHDVHLTRAQVERAEKEAGVLPKYQVTRNNDPQGKHDGCWYFVLDPTHDPLAVDALYAYAQAAARAGYHALAHDLHERASLADSAPYTPVQDA